MSEAPALRALLVGIDHYPASPAAGGVHLPVLRGAVHDVTTMERYLRQRLGVPAERVRTLVSPAPDGPAAGAAGGEPPTLDRLLAALARLCDEARPGEQVLIQFSGHGTRLRTAFPELKGGEHGFDEALVPCDGAAPEAPLLLDVHLALVLWRLAERGAVTTLVLDCCHSGGLVRQAPGVGVRCAEALVGARRPLAAGPFERADLAAAWERWRPAAESPLRHWGEATGWLPAPRRYVLLAACLAAESAHEMPAGDGRHHGALTRFLLAALAHPHPGLTWEGLAGQVRAAVQGEFRDQHPHAEGEVGRRVFGGELPRPRPAVDVLEVTDGGRRLRLGAGRAHGLAVGSRLAVHRPLADDPEDGGERLCVVEVVAEAGPAESWAEVVHQAPRPAAHRVETPPRVAAGARAVLLEVAGLDLASVVGTRVRGDGDSGGDASLPPEVAARLRETVAARGGGWLRWCSGGDVPHFQVAVDHDGGFRVRDRGGAVLPLRPALAADAGHVERLVERLAHLARFRNVETLRNEDAGSYLAGRLALELLTEGPPAAGDPTFHVGESVTLLLRNRSRYRLHAAVLDLRPDWGIRQVLPGLAGGRNHALEPWTEERFTIRADLPPGIDRGRDVLKLMAALEDTRFRWLELPPLDRPSTPRGDACASPLERLFAALAADAGLLRDFEPAACAAEEWATAQAAAWVVRGGGGDGG